MRMLALGALLLAAASAVADSPRPWPDVGVFVPVDPREHERLRFFDRRPHHLMPGTVTISGSPYRCDPDGERFEDEDAFIAHLRGAHHVAPRRIPEMLVVRDGVVHFVGEFGE